jgi:hypothetical protein
MASMLKPTPAGPLLALVGSLALGLAVAQTQDGQSGGQPPPPPRGGPPPEALAACKSLASGASCSFTSPRGSMTGTCWAPEGKPLACKPAGAPPGSGGGSPPAQR